MAASPGGRAGRTCASMAAALAALAGVSASAADDVPFVQEFECVTRDEGVQFTWRNPVTYDSLELYRYSERIAALPGDAASFFYSCVPPLNGRYEIVGFLGDVSKDTACLVGDSVPALRATDARGHPGGRVSVRIMLDDLMHEGASGWHFGVRHDDGKLELLSVANGAFTATVNLGGPPDFEDVNLDPAECEPPALSGFTVGCVVNLQCMTFMTPGTDYELHVATYAVKAAAPDSTTVLFSSDLGCPPVSPGLTFPGTDIVPRVLPGTVTIDEALFRRGDTNGDGRVDIADAVFSLGYLFAEGAAPGCLDAADVNDDGAVDIADPIAFLRCVFFDPCMAPSPLAVCGVDPSADSLSCDSFPPCD